MGDMADYAIQNGTDEYLAHAVGECEYGCPYCEEEENANTVEQLEKAEEV